MSATVTNVVSGSAAPPSQADDRGPRWREPWRRARWPLAIASAVVLAAVAGLLLVRPSQSGYLDPGSASPDGARALVRVLGDHGLPVEVRTSFGQVAADLDRHAEGVTVVVARPDLLVGERTQDLRRAVADAGADLVLLGAGNALLSDLDLPLRARAEDDDAVREPGCPDVVAARAGSALSGGVSYQPVPGSAPSGGGQTGSAPSGSAPSVTRCYLVDGRATYVALTGAGGGRITLVGSGRAFSNAELGSAGNAALAVGTLGARSYVVWWTPNPLDSGATSAPTLSDLVPRGVWWGLTQVLVAVLVALLWRGRRLGGLVTEPLPVVVRSVETTLGRGRLYRRARARGRAAQVLRVAAVRRLAVACSLPRTAAPGTVADAVAVRTGRPAAEVGALVVGPDPADDVALVRLARALDELETQVRRA